MDRPYVPETDYGRVSEFLVRTYPASEIGQGGNWLQPRWEYMHHHAFIRGVDLGRIRIWEAEGEIVGVVHPEHQNQTVYLEVDPARADLKEEMVRYAAGSARRIFIHDFDEAFQRAAADAGYEKDGGSEAMSRFDIAGPLLEPSVPSGFRIASLADDDDPEKMHRVLWRGFNHEGEPPPGGAEERAFMQSAPNFRKDLNIVIVAPDGGFVSYCGMWYEPRHRIAVVEPVATDPDYRRMGLAEAAVLEAIRRCEREGATAAYVATDMPFYLSLGFRRTHGLSAWRRSGE